jgi:hypothetical protein
VLALLAALLVSSMALAVRPAAADASGTTSPDATTTTKPSGPLAALSAAVANTLATGSAQVHLRLSNGKAFGKPGRSLAGSGEYSFVDTQGFVRLKPEVIFAAAQLYVKTPAVPATSTAPRPWTFIDLDSLEVAEVKYQGLMSQVESINPALMLQVPAWGGVKAEVSDAKGGAQTFTVTVDLERAADHAAGPVQRTFVSVLKAQAGKQRRIPVTVAVDHAGRVTRVSYSPPGIAVGTTTLSISGFGSSVDVRAPTQDQVTNLLQVLEAAEGETNGSGESNGS